MAFIQETSDSKHIPNFCLLFIFKFVLTVHFTDCLFFDIFFSLLLQVKTSLLKIDGVVDPLTEGKIYSFQGVLKKKASSKYQKYRQGM